MTAELSLKALRLIRTISGETHNRFIIIDDDNVFQIGAMTGALERRGVKRDDNPDE